MAKIKKEKKITRKTRKPMSAGVYLDYAATTPVDATVLRAMQPYFSQIFGNTESIHSFGQAAMQALDTARMHIADALAVDFREIIFTGSATEANTMVLQGVTRSFPLVKKPNIILSAIEHASVFNTAVALRQQGIEIRFIKPDQHGLITPRMVQDALDENTLLVSIQFANNEVGTIEPIAAIGNILRTFRGEKKFPLFHSDAVQAFQFLPVHPHELGVDFLTLSSHKLYGPKGVGLLFIRAGTPLQPLFFGGNQEFHLRPGTVNLPSIVGFAAALVLAEKNRRVRTRKVFLRKKEFIAGLKTLKAQTSINGFSETGKGFAHALPNVVNVYFPKFSAEHIVVGLDLAGVAVSAGSACNARGTTSSRVIREMTDDEDRARKSIRFSFGEKTTNADIRKTIRILKKIAQDKV